MFLVPAPVIITSFLKRYSNTFVVGYLKNTSNKSFFEHSLTKVHENTRIVGGPSYQSLLKVKGFSNGEKVVKLKLV